MLPQLGVNSVRPDHDVTFHDGSVRERHAGDGAVALETGATVSGAHHAGRQRLGQHVHKVGTMHAVCRVPTRRIRNLNRRDQRSVVAEVA